MPEPKSFFTTADDKRNIAALAEQTNVAWCFARQHSDHVTLEEAARYVITFHVDQIELNPAFRHHAYAELVKSVIAIAFDQLPSSFQQDVQERASKAR